MHCQWGRKSDKNAPSPWDFITLTEEDRATAIGNMHKEFGSGDMLADRQTNTQTCSSQITILRYAPVGEVVNHRPSSTPYARAYIYNSVYRNMFRMKNGRM